MRGFLAAVSGLVAVVALAVALPAAWVAASVADEDGFVSLSRDVVTDGAVQDAASDLLTTRLEREAGLPAQLAETDRWTGYAAAYRVNGATVTGELLVPKGDGPFPALVLNHGYIDPAIYTLGRGMSREQEWFAAAGFVVLHTDYRGHAGSDPVSPMGRETRLVYTRDAIGAVKALKRMDYVDADRTAFVGRSMGGGVTLNAIVAEPDLVDAAVVFASVSSRFVDNLRQFTEPNRPEGARAFYDEHGTPEESPRFYRDLSSRTFFDRVEVPVMLTLVGFANRTRAKFSLTDAKGQAS